VHIWTASQLPGMLVKDGALSHPGEPDYRDRRFTATPDGSSYDHEAEVNVVNDRRREFCATKVTFREIRAP
jgi:hypothetical protein